MRVKLIKDMSKDFQGNAALYQVLDENPRCEYVLISGIDTWLAKEVMMFPADKDGNVLSWAELAVRRGTTDHKRLVTIVE